MKNKKGFTLVELLAVIAILAILVIIALPNVMKLFNNARKDSFFNEVKIVYKEVTNKYISESFKGNALSHIYYNDSTALDLDGHQLKYCIELNGTGKILYLKITDGKYFFESMDDVKDYKIEDVKDYYESDFKCNSNIITGTVFLAENVQEIVSPDKENNEGVIDVPLNPGKPTNTNNGGNNNSNNNGNSSGNNTNPNITCTNTMSYDKTEDNNLRYVGKNPCNYVRFNDELWRIIGFFNNIDDGSGKKETRMKIVRASSIGNFVYDSSSRSETSPSGRIDDTGFNDWAVSDMMTILNEGYNDKIVKVVDNKGKTTEQIASNSLYWNRGNGNCTNGQSNKLKECNFSSTGLKNEWKDYIDNAVWSLYSVTQFNQNYTGIKNTGGTPTQFYQSERGINNYSFYKYGDLANHTTWTGKIGLIYPTDYAFSTSSKNCRTNVFALWSKNATNCPSETYLNHNENMWLITPLGHNWNYSLNINSNGFIESNTVGAKDNNKNVSNAFAIYPTLYLKSSIKLTKGVGDKTDPYILGM